MAKATAKMDAVKGAAESANQEQEHSMSNETAIETNVESQADAGRQAQIRAAWTDKSQAIGTVKAKTVKHKIRQAPVDKEGNAKPGHEQSLGAVGETIEVYSGPIDLAPLWDCKDEAILRSYAAQALLLDAGERYKAKFLRGEVQANDPAAMAQCLAEGLSRPAAMQQITSAQGGNGTAKAPGKLKAAEAKLARLAELAEQRRTLMAQIKADPKAAIREGLFDKLDALEAEEAELG